LNTVRSGDLAGAENLGRLFPWYLCSNFAELFSCGQGNPCREQQSGRLMVLVLAASKRVCVLAGVNKSLPRVTRLYRRSCVAGVLRSDRQTVI